MRASHWSALGMFATAIAVQLANADTWHAAFSVSGVASLLLQCGAVATALGSRSVLGQADKE